MRVERGALEQLQQLQLAAATAMRDALDELSMHYMLNSTEYLKASYTSSLRPHTLVAQGRIH